MAEEACLAASLAKQAQEDTRQELASRTGGIDSKTTFAIAFACGAAVANLYYPQPLLHAIAHDFHASAASADLVVTFSQLGFAAGLAFVVPAGDVLARRKLVPALFVLAALGLAASAAAPNIWVLGVMALLVGLGAVAAQVLVPLAAALADDASRGRVVGTVMSGLLVGILIARSVSGAVAGASSWRVVYIAAAVAMVVFAVASRGFLPDELHPRHMLSYPEVLKSTLRLLRQERLLRQRALLGALSFGSFSVFWTTMAFLLSSPPYHYSPTTIGLFGLIGAAGAICASIAGRLADRGHAPASTIAFASLLLISFLVMWVGRSSLQALIVGIVALDLGAQGLQVTNQSIIYSLAPSAQSRSNSAYMVFFFIGGAIGSLLAGLFYDKGGWTAVCSLGALAGAGATALGVRYKVLSRSHKGAIAGS